MPSKEIKSATKEADLKWATVRRAADDLGVRKIHPDIRGPWFWELPGHQGAHQDAQGAHSSEGEQLGHLGEHLGTPSAATERAR